MGDFLAAMPTSHVSGFLAFDANSTFRVTLWADHPDQREDGHGHSESATRFKPDDGPG